PQIVRLFIDQAQAGAPVDTLIRAAGLFLALRLLGQVLSVLTSYVSSKVSWRATNRMRTDLTKHCLSLDMAFHPACTPGELFERIDGDVQQLANFLSLFAVQVLGNLLLLGGILVALALEDWRVGLVFTVFSILALLLLYRVRGATSGLWQRARDASANLYGFLEERLAGIANPAQWRYAVHDTALSRCDTDPVPRGALRE
ncbi:MAG: ABC transporter ATP-binding protein, partial [Chloroflexales bacterium]|nr:ABC transporter ATP-binding protein [Chloroflexales bacterium]